MLSHKASAICSLHHLTLSIAPRAPVAAALASVRRQAPFICQARSGRFGSQHPEADDEVGGDKNVQDTLADLLQIEVIRQQVKQDIMDDLEIRKDSLRQIGQELNDELDAQYADDVAATATAGNTAVNESLAALDDVEEQIRSIKAQVQADKEDLANYEIRSATERSQSLFFKSLYKPPADAIKIAGAASGRHAGVPRDGDASSSTASSSAWDNMDEDARVAARRLASKVVDPATQAVRSPGRVYLFSGLAAVLFVLALQDANGAAPSYPQDALYCGIAGLLVWTAYRERDELIAANAESLRILLQGRSKPSSGKDKQE